PISAAPTTDVFRVHDLHAGYGATPILFGVSLEVRAGEAVALLGRNGMGKTTLLKTIIGFLKPWRGTIELEGRDLTRLTPHDIARVMVAGARIVLMDEPTQGLAPAFIRHIRDMIGELKRLGVTVVLIEQNARVALSVCDRGYIMEKGTIVFEAPARELRDSPI